jgi:hypothetical protein
MNQSNLDTVILNHLALSGAYDHQTGILRYGTWLSVARILNRMGFTTPTEHVSWTAQSAAIYYRRNLREKDAQHRAFGHR